MLFCGCVRAHRIVLWCLRCCSCAGLLEFVCAGVLDWFVVAEAFCEIFKDLMCSVAVKSDVDIDWDCSIE